MTGARLPFVDYRTHSPEILRNENDATRINHFSYEAYRFVRDVLGTVARPVREWRFPGIRASYSDAAIEGAAFFAASVDLSPSMPVVMYNPDTASRFTMMPFDAQAALLQEIPGDLSTRVFERFVTTKAAGKGTGLGLWIVRQTVSSLGGVVTATNLPAGGARIRIEIPD